MRVVPPGTVRYGALRRARRGRDARLREHRRLRRRGHHGRHLGHRRQLRAGRARTCTSRAASASAACSSRPRRRPVIIEDGAFIGSRCIVVEGVVVEEEAVLGANVVLTASTQIIDVTGPRRRCYKGRVPARSVVIPGMRAKKFPAGELPGALRADHRPAQGVAPTRRPRSTPRCATSRVAGLTLHAMTPVLRPRALAERTLELCRIPSVIGDERALADHVEAWARRHFAPPSRSLRVGHSLVLGHARRSAARRSRWSATWTPCPRTRGDASAARSRATASYGLGART